MLTGSREGGVRLMLLKGWGGVAGGTYLQAYSMLDMKVTGLTLRDVSIT